MKSLGMWNFHILENSESGGNVGTCELNFKTWGSFGKIELWGNFGKFGWGKRQGASGRTAGAEEQSGAFRHWVRFL